VDERGTELEPSGVELPGAELAGVELACELVLEGTPEEGSDDWADDDGGTDEPVSMTLELLSTLEEVELAHGVVGLWVTQPQTASTLEMMPSKKLTSSPHAPMTQLSASLLPWMAPLYSHWH
jgi:hypothetical protein